MHRSLVRQHQLVAMVFALGLASWLGGCQPQQPEPQPAAPAVQANPETGVLITLTQDQDPNPMSCKVYRSQHQDHVRWVNTTGVARTITFQPGIWPFEETQGPITVSANSQSHWFTIGPSLQIRQYTYQVNPPLRSGPPGEPDVSGGD